MPSLNFPTATTVGEQYLDWVWNGVGWDSLQTLPGGLPAGSIIQWGGATAPVNWLLCDGSAVSRTTYASLFAAVGTAYGTGDGTTTFNLPDVPNGDSAGIINSVRINSQVTVTQTLTDLSGLTQTITLKGGRTYRITFSSPNLNCSGTGRSRFDIMANGTLVARDYVGIASGIGGVAFNVQALFTPSSDGSYTMKVAGMVDAGTATTMTVYADGNSTTLFNVEDLGEAAGSALRTRAIIKATAAVTPGESELAPRVGALESGRALKSGDTFTGTIIGKTNTGGAQSTSYDFGSLSARGDGSNAAVISFHRPTLSAINIGIDTDNKFKIGGWSFPIDSLNIDMSGRVTKAVQPGFLCYTSTGTASKTGGSWSNIATFPTSGGAATAVASHNIGGHWNSSNGRFTAPVAGRYMFQVGGWANYNGAGNRYAYCFQQNGGAYNFIGGGGTTAADSPMAGYSAILNLAAGDYVDLAMFSSVTMGMGSPSHYMWWGGYLLG